MTDKLTSEQESVINLALKRAEESRKRFENMTPEERAKWGLTEKSTESQAARDEAENPSTAKK